MRINKWTVENEMEINQKKSGIIFFSIGCHRYYKPYFNGFPVVENYTYLGWNMNRKLNCE